MGFLLDLGKIEPVRTTVVQVRLNLTAVLTGAIFDLFAARLSAIVAVAGLLYSVHDTSAETGALN